MADPRRRTGLHYLSENGDRPVGTGELRARLRADANGGGGPRPTDRERRSLEHVHRPMLATAGVVTYDATGDAVRSHDRERIEKLRRFVAAERA